MPRENNSNSVAKYVLVLVYINSRQRFAHCRRNLQVNSLISQNMQYADTHTYTIRQATVCYVCMRLFPLIVERGFPENVAEVITLSY
jgi:hypothetical protein